MPWDSSVCFGFFVLIIRGRTGGRRSHLVLLGSFWLAHGVEGFIWVRCVYSDVPWGSSGSFYFIRPRPRDRRVDPGSSGKFERAIKVFGLNRFRWIN